MAKYRKLFVRLWGDMAGMKPLEKLTTIYLLCGPQANRIGYYRLSISALAEEFGITKKEADTVYHRVCHTLEWKFDTVSSVLFLPCWWLWNPPDNQKALIGALVDLDDIPSSCLYDEWYQALEKLPANLTAVAKRIIRDPMAYRMAYPDPSSRIPYAIQGEVEVEVEVEGKGTPKPPRGANNEFEQFWKAYPKHRHKNLGDAEKAWKQTEKERPPLPELLAKLQTLTQSHDWTKEGGQFVPYPATWLRRKGWADEVDASKRSYEWMGERL